MYLEYNSVIFNINSSLDKEFKYTPIEKKNKIYWKLIANWYIYLMANHKPVTLIQEYNKLPTQDREELLKITLHEIYYSNLETSNIVLEKL